MKVPESNPKVTLSALRVAQVRGSEGELEAALIAHQQNLAEWSAFHAAEKADSQKEVSKNGSDR